MRAVGHNPMEMVGGSVSDGYSGRLTDTLTGAGLFNANLDPAVVGQDEDGVAYATGIDMSFGSAIRRQIHTNVINGDFAVLPPLGVGSAIDSEPSSTTYNPLPGWTWTPPSDGSFTLTVVADAIAASGYALQFNGSAASGQDCHIKQMIAVPMSLGQQYRLLASFYTIDADYWFQFYKADGTTAIGSEVYAAGSGVAGERKIDVGLVPTNAAYLLLKVGRVAGSSVTRKVYEVRCAFLPAEATIGLGSISAASGNIDSGTGETAVKSVTIPANTFVVGSVYRITAWATVTSTAGNVVTVRVRIGPTTLTGAIVESINPTATATATNEGVRFDAMVTVRSVGATGTVTGAMSFVGSASEPFTNPTRTDVDTGTVTIDTTVANLLELTAVTAAGTTDINFRQAVIECVMAS